MDGKILVIGGGMMGSGIAAVAAHAGSRVTVVEPDEAVRGTLKDRIFAITDELYSNGLLEDCQIAGLEERLACVSDLDDYNEKPDLVVEAISENLALKQELFGRLDKKFPVSVPLASNTSGLRITDITADVGHKERTLTTHFWFPAHLVLLVEVVMSEWTDRAMAVGVRELLKSWGKAPVLVQKDLPGQLANRIFQAVIREAAAIVEQGIASPADVDTAVKMGMGMRFPVWGPLEHVDAVGLELCESVQNNVLPSISAAQEAAGIFREKLTRGANGAKSGEGFYDWTVRSMPELEQLRNAYIMQSVKFLRNYGKRK